MKFATLTCRRDLEVALVCLRSFLENVSGVTGLRVFDDGSLGPDEMARLAALDPRVETAAHAERSPQVKELLSKHPKALAFRDQHPLAQKLFDACLLSEGEAIHFVDSDVLFIRKLNLSDLDGVEAFMLKDDEQGYSGRLMDLLNCLSQMPSHGNTGFFRLPRERYDLDQIEYYLDTPKLCVMPSMIEQTLLSWMVAFGKSCYIDNRQIPCPQTLTDTSAPELIAIHLMGEQKKHCEELAHLAQTEQTARIRTLPMEYLTPLGILSRKLRRMLKR